MIAANALGGGWGGKSCLCVFNGKGYTGNIGYLMQQTTDWVLYRTNWKFECIGNWFVEKVKWILYGHENTRFHGNWKYSEIINELSNDERNEYFMKYNTCPSPFLLFETLTSKRKYGTKKIALEPITEQYISARCAY